MDYRLGLDSVESLIMVDMSFSRKKVRRSLLQRELLGGVPQTGLLALVVLTVMFCYVLEMYVALVPIAIMYFVMRHMTAKDQWLIDIIIDNVMQKDRFIP